MQGNKDQLLNRNKARQKIMKHLTKTNKKKSTWNYISRQKNRPSKMMVKTFFQEQNLE